LSRKIISASRRSDIPAFYSRWFLRRVEEGFSEWVNPFGGQVGRVSLRPEDCLAIVCWTRNPSPLLPALAELRRAGHFFYFHFTITRYPRELESHAPPLETAVRVFRKLAETLGPEAVIWRYDPIVLSSLTPAEFHLARFEALARELRGATRRAYVSFVVNYGKTKKNFAALTKELGIAFHDPELAEKKELALRLRDIAARHEMKLHACCNDEIVGDGIEKGHCVDLEIVKRIRPDGESISEDLKRRPTREQCGCTESVDIGAYDTCIFGCRYCYATRNREAALARFREHDPGDTLLWRPPHLRADFDGP
jgi:DNA repair photolyase